MQSPLGPPAPTISGNTLTWTPTHAQSRVSNTFTITATTSNNGTATQTFTSRPTGISTGTAVDHAMAGGTLVDYPQDLSAATIEVLLPNNKGGYNHRRGTGDASGNFTDSQCAGREVTGCTCRERIMALLRIITSGRSPATSMSGNSCSADPTRFHATSGVTIAAQNIGLCRAPVTSSDSMRMGQPGCECQRRSGGPPHQSLQCELSSKPVG